MKEIDSDIVKKHVIKIRLLPVEAKEQETIIS